MKKVADRRSKTDAAIDAALGDEHSVAVDDRMAYDWATGLGKPKKKKD